MIAPRAWLVRQEDRDEGGNIGERRGVQDPACAGALLTVDQTQFQQLAFGPAESLYVTGPTVSSFDAILKINQDGETDVFFKGLGRPQGLAFDLDGNLYVAASLRGRRGIVRISPDGQASIVVAGVNLIGLAFSGEGEMAVVSTDSVYSLPMQIKGTLLP